MIEEMNCNSLENIYGCMVVVLHMGFALSLVHWKSFTLPINPQNRTTFPLQTTCNTRYMNVLHDYKN